MGAPVHIPSEIRGCTYGRTFVRGGVLDGVYFKSSIVQYSIVPEYIAVRERHYDMTRLGILQLGTR